MQSSQPTEHTMTTPQLVFTYLQLRGELPSASDVQPAHVAVVGVAVAIALAGGLCSIAGAVVFRRARTTVNPMKPESTSSLVRSGIYRVTRNPLYVGLILVLIAWAVFLSAPVSFLGPVAFLLYIGRFQIVPEERVLARLFGVEYAEYTRRVRRWL
jgi:protein-S-isoprenylcysteine O-methyltransferase Ste14